MQKDILDIDKAIGNQVKKIEDLDIFTSKHVHNVQKITVKLCEKLGIDEEKTKIYASGALLHDIGKIFIPPYVLQKPSKLTDEEFEIMKSHTIKGYELCMAQDELKKYANVVRYHHENEDGSGYPDGLKKDEIPIEAKIIKVADIYDAISSKRQYKPEIERVDALKIVAEEVENGKIDSKVFNGLIDVVIDEITIEGGSISKIEELKQLKK